MKSKTLIKAIATFGIPLTLISIFAIGALVISGQNQPAPAGTTPSASNASVFSSIMNAIFGTIERPTGADSERVDPLGVSEVVETSSHTSAKPTAQKPTTTDAEPASSSTPAETPSDTPTETPSEPTTPPEEPAETPAETPSEEPPVETPTETPAETPSDTPSGEEE